MTDFLVLFDIIQNTLENPSKNKLFFENAVE